MTSPKRVLVIGAGPAGLAAAEVMAQAGCAVTIAERMPSPARKFLMAGRGGLNLTHSEPWDRFRGRYGLIAPQLSAALDAFDQNAAIAWCEGLGQPTFAGSSGRVFPQAMKASPLLRAWLARLDALGVRLLTRHRWVGFSPEGARFATPDGEVALTADAIVLAMGGASWPRLGADGSWTQVLNADGLEIAPLTPSNVGVRIAWSPYLIEKFAGHPLKRIGVACGAVSVRGEAVITRQGLEGGAVYGIGPAVRVALAKGYAKLRLDLRPDIERPALAKRLAAARGKASLSNHLRKAAGLSPAAIALLREGEGSLPEAPEALADRIKALTLKVDGLSGMDRAISTAGGLRFEELDERLMLKARPGTFAAGEMLDWDAPTGGYLLQACFATGRAAGHGAILWLQDQAAARTAPASETS